jgi:uncharacterized cupin superfamily protein
VSETVSIVEIDPNSAERFQLLRRELGVTTFGLNAIVLQPGQRGRIHLHERQEEVFVVLQGTLTLATPTGEHDLTQWQAVRVAPEVRRQLVNRGPEPVVMLAIGGATPHDGRDGIAFVDFDDADGRTPQETPLPEDLPPGELRT